MRKAKWSIVLFGDTYINDTCEIRVGKSLQAILNRSSIRSLNLEGSINFTNRLGTRKVGILLAQNRNIFKFIASNKFNLINLANNHVYDYEEDGLKKILFGLKNVSTIGAGHTFKDAYKLKTVTIEGYKVGFLSFTENQFGTLFDESLTRGGTAWVNHRLVNKLIIDAKKNVDYLLVQIHAGVEDVFIPLPEWRARYKEIIDCGADCIIGHHPHVPQGWELYKHKPIFYSLGNFTFDYSSTESNVISGYAVELKFTKIKTMKYIVHPLTSKNHTIDLDNTKPTKEFLLYLCSLLKDDRYSKYLDKMILELWENRYKQYYEDSCFALTKNNLFKRFLHGIYKKVFGIEMQNKLLLLHNIRIESHLWTTVRALNILNKNP